jgi:hypothetical protein
VLVDRAVTTISTISSERPVRTDVRRLDRMEWEAAVQDFRDHSYRQCWAYGVALAAKRSAVSEHVAIEHDDALVGLADVRVKKLPVIGGGLAYVSGGPLVRAGDDELDRLGHCVDALVREFVDRRGLTLRLQPAVGDEEHNAAVADRLIHAGFRATEHGLYRTVLLDIERDPDALMASLSKDWRQNIRRGERKGVEIGFGAELERFETFSGMLEELRARKAFDVDLDDRFFAAVQADLPEQERLIVGIASVDGVAVAGNVTTIHGDTAVYLLGATTDAGLRSQASYVLHWRTIELLRERGISWYDLGGIDPEANPGVADFKLRTNGLDVTAAGPFERSPDGARGRVAGWAEQAYVRARRGR